MTTNEITVTEAGNAIATLNNEAAEAMKRLYAQSLKKTVSSSQFPAITMQHGVKRPKFEIGEDEQSELNAGIINFTTGREYYPSEDVKVPECISVGGTNGTLYGECRKCSFHQWGTGKNGKGRACKEYRRVLLSVSDREGVFELKLPATSLKVFEDLVEKIQIKEASPVQKFTYKFKLDVQEQQGRKPWSVINITKDKDLSEVDPEYAAKILSAVVEHEKAYTATPLNENPSKPSEMPKAPNIPDSPSAETVVVDEDNGLPF